jgi:type I restriction enzyme S subunit
MKIRQLCIPSQTVDPTRKPDDAFRYVDISAVDNKRKRIVASKEIFGRDAPSRARLLINTGDVLVATTRPNLNAVAIVPPELDGQVCSTGFCVLKPKPSTDSEFLFFGVQSPAFVGALTELARGANYPAVSDKQVMEQVLRCPDLSVQRQVAARLKAQMQIIERCRDCLSVAHKGALDLLDKTISDAFHDITPLSVGRDEAPAPEGWRWHSLLDLARLATGHTPSRRCPEYWADGDIPWLALPDIRALDCRVATETSEKTNALGIANSSARVLPPGTVALSRTASVGFVTIFGCEMATSQDFVNWVCGPELHAPFLLWLLRTSRAFIKGVSTGAVHQTVYMDVVERFRVCLPDLPAQQKVAARLDEAFRLIQQLQSAHEAQLEALDKLPGAYLREAFGSL